MAQRARIRLIGNDPHSIQKICNQIQKIAERTGVRIRGPIPLPSKRIVLPVRKSPCGNGTATYDHFEMKLHKRISDMDAEEKSMRLLMRIHVPEDVHIEIAIERK
ncbi:MAG: 30S ribosomal protein S10 [Candidatus Heimdallarchaeaceae archaeon]|jgi:small subunit ribosomal protein S10